MSFWNILKGASALIVLGYITISILSGAITAASTGDFKPLLDGTLGLIVNSDNEAYRAATELTNIEQHNLMPEKFTSAYLLYLRHRILLNLAVVFLVIYSIYRIFAFFAGMRSEDPTTQMLIILFAVLSYIVLGVVYNVILYMFFEQSSNILWDIVPAKGLIYSILNSPTILSVQSPEVYNATKELINTTVITNATA